MPSVRDPDDMTEEQRMQEVGRLLATGILRVRSRPTTAASPSLNPQESVASPLELSPATRLSVTTVNGVESPQRGEQA